MARTHLSDKLVDLERTTRADIFNAPTERVIAQGRLLLCALSMLAIQFDPTQPTQFAEAAQLLLGIYFALAAILVALTRYRFLTPRTRQTIHCADVGIISVLLFLTDGPNSPFFVFFTFALLAAMLRWQWQAVVATALALTVALLIVRFNNARPADIVGNTFNTEIIRGASLIVAGGMLAYASAFYRRSRERFAMLAPWPSRKSGQDNVSSVLQLLAHSAIVLEAPRIIAIWEEDEEPYINLISWREGSFQETRRAAGTYGDLVNPVLADATFLTGDVASEFVLLPSGPMRLNEPVIDLNLRVEFSIRGVATAPFVGTSCAGRVFIFDRDTWSDDHLLLTEIIASRTGVELDRQVAQRRGEEAVALRERMRLTRDLHDGVLQSLTAAALQLNLADQAPDQDRRSRLDLVKRLLASEQRRVREFIDQVFPKPNVERYTILGPDLQRQLEETASHWDCIMSFSVAPPDTKVPEAIAGQLSLILAEAFANAARHGKASKVDVVIEKTKGSLVVNVCDNGRGFDGELIQTPNQARVVASPEAASVHQRVSALGGSLTVSSSPSGANLAIRLPVP